MVVAERVGVEADLAQDLDEAVRIATRAAVAFVCDRTGADAATAYAWLSAAADLSVSQVVDRVKGVHFALPKRWLDRVKPARIPYAISE